VVLVGNSLGGYSALLASAAGATSKESVKGLVLVNAAGPLVENDKQDDPFWSLANDLDEADNIDTKKGFSLGEILKKRTVFFGFLALRSKSRVLQVLSQVIAPLDTRKDGWSNVNPKNATIVHRIA
jgi:pimeloyl-ACP methyl ester carboxylesterase